jgi:hypothetical protein
MAIKKRMRDGTIKYVTYKHEESENQEAEDHEDKDLQIKRLEALIELLESRIKQLETNKPKGEVPSSDVMTVAAASTYSCYS